jgi:putative redox protein
MQIRHIEGYKFEIEERGIKVVTDQPRPVGGNEGLAPVEFLGASLGACVGVFAADYLMRNNLATDGLTIDVAWQGASQPHRVGHFQVQVNVPVELSDRQRASLSRIVQGCTVHNTLHHPPEIRIDLAEPRGDGGPA